MRAELTLFCFLCTQATLVRLSLLTKINVHTTGNAMCSDRIAVFTYNVCNDPKHPQTTFSESNQNCDVDRMFTRVTMEVTRSEKHSIDTHIHEFENDHIKCETTVHRLRHQQLTSRINISSSQFECENVYTRTYLKLAKLTYLFQQLNCKMAPIFEECCLSFPVYIFQHLKKRLLNKWFLIQDKCGEMIGQAHCDVTTEITIDSPMRCEDARDVIYLLLKHARGVLHESIPVINFAYGH